MTADEELEAARRAVAEATEPIDVSVAAVDYASAGIRCIGEDLFTLCRRWRDFPDAVLGQIQVDAARAMLRQALGILEGEE
jgi:hypothetical protein